jgi:hypothetical protein
VSGIGRCGLAGRIKSVVLTCLDRALQLGEFSIDLFFQQIEAALLLGIILGELL